ncbi:MAG: LuxR C-terminal-related transcriptional regulator [Spirochaetaceae bacterium]|jgi:DNA-binding CsgD family transcriptional regulator|nr:LuxR C-terminal-related transcriptional regulator [Spirochaetaceae bacterium]
MAFQDIFNPIRRFLSPESPGIFKKNSFSLSLRLFAFLAVFAAAIILVSALIFFSTGVFSLGLAENRVFLENELAHIAGRLENGYSVLSAEGVSLSKKLTKQIERELDSLGASPEDLKKRPGLIEPVLRALMDPLITALEKNVASGVYVALDATVNPAAPGAENSRAGIAIQNSEPNVLNRSASSLHYLKGPRSLVRDWGLYMRPQWTMEFTVSPGDFWYETMKFARVDMDISRLYRWVPASVSEGDYREVIRLCVPLRASDGAVLGVCGFDISDMLFKLQNVPDNSVHRRVFSLFGPVNGNFFDASRSLIAANQGTRFKLSGILSIEGNRGALPLFTDSEGRYTGLWRPVKLYPGNAVHSGQQWAAAVMMPQGDLDAYVMRRNRGILALLLVLLILSVALAIPLSRRYFTPVYRAIDRVKEKGFSDYEKTHIREIDDLFAFLAERDERAAQNGAAGEAEKQNTRAAAALTARFNVFLKNLATLSKAERSVFNLYAQGHSAKEIAYTLYLSMNTIKTHNKRIYAKLGVSSRKEMMVYVDMMNGGDSHR